MTRNVHPFDLETAKAEELFRREDFMKLGGYVSRSGSTVLTTDGHEIARELTAIVAAGGDIAGHNIHAFDLPVLAHWHGLRLSDLRGHTIDTDLYARLTDPPPSGKDGNAVRPRGYYGLDATSKRYGVPGKTDDLKALMKKHGGFDMIPADDPEYRSYLEGDLVASGALVSSMPDLDAYARRDMDVALMTAQMTVNGFRVDIAEIRRALEDQAKRKTENLAEIATITGMTLKGKSPLASAQGKAAVMDTFVSYGLKRESLPRTDKGAPSLGGTELREFLEKIKSQARGRDISKISHLIELVCSVVSERTIYQTAENCRIGDRVHPQIKATQASGRWSVTAPGLTVFGKRGGRHIERRIMLPEIGHSLLAVDLDQVDARAVAAHSHDEGYLRIFREGLDLHAENALVAFGDRKRREDAKPIGHGWNYGMSPHAMSLNGVDIELARLFDRRMRSTYPKLVEWQNHVRGIAGRGELLDNGFGRKMLANPAFAYTQAPALVGQGCTRDIIAEGMLRLPLEFWPYMRVIVHDEIVFSVPTKDAVEIGREIVKAMSFDLADVTNGRLASCPITAGVSKPSANWAACYEK